MTTQSTVFVKVFENICFDFWGFSVDVSVGVTVKEHETPGFFIYQKDSIDFTVISFLGNHSLVVVELLDSFFRNNPEVKKEIEEIIIEKIEEGQNLRFIQGEDSDFDEVKVNIKKQNVKIFKNLGIGFHGMSFRVSGFMGDNYVEEWKITSIEGIESRGVINFVEKAIRSEECDLSDFEEEIEISFFALQSQNITQSNDWRSLDGTCPKWEPL